MREYLSCLRRKQNLSQQQVADMIGVSQNYYSMIETGARKRRMDITLAEKLAECFGVGVEYIIQQEKKIITPKAG